MLRCHANFSRSGFSEFFFFLKNNIVIVGYWEKKIRYLVQLITALNPNFIFHVIARYNSMVLVCI